MNPSKIDTVALFKTIINEMPLTDIEPGYIAYASYTDNDDKEVIVSDDGIDALMHRHDPYEGVGDINVVFHVNKMVYDTFHDAIELFDRIVERVKNKDY